MSGIEAGRGAKLMAFPRFPSGLDRSGNSCKTCGCTTKGSSTCIYCNSGTTPKKMQIVMTNFIDYTANCNQCASVLNNTFLITLGSSVNGRQVGTAACEGGLHMSAAMCGYDIDITCSIGTVGFALTSFPGISVYIFMPTNSVNTDRSVYGFRYNPGLPFDCTTINNMSLPYDSTLNPIAANLLNQNVFLCASGSGPAPTCNVTAIY